MADRVFTAFPNVLPRPSGWATRCAPSSCGRPPPPSALRAAAARCGCWWWGAAWAPRRSTTPCRRPWRCCPSTSAPWWSTRAARSRSRRCAPTTRRPVCRPSSRPSSTTPPQAFAHADLIVCRAGASTVTEIAAVGAAALFVPFPHGGGRPPDHQRPFPGRGGRRLAGAADRTHPQSLAERLRSVNRAQLLEMAIKAKQMEKTQAVAAVVAACEQLAKVKAS